MQTIQILLHKYKGLGDPILFFVNYNDRGWWIEGYDKFGHSECSKDFIRKDTAPATYDEEANRFALEWARAEPACHIEVVEVLTAPEGLPYIGN